MKNVVLKKIKFVLLVSSFFLVINLLNGYIKSHAQFLKEAELLNQYEIKEVKEEKKKELAKNQFLLLVNKDNPISSDYIPNDLVEPNVTFSFSEDSPKKLMRKEAADALEELFIAAKREGFILLARSGYRSFQTQEAIFTYNANIKGEEIANQTSAYPGQSEHQSGLAMDITSDKVNRQLIEAFGSTVEGRWIENHAYEYGFIIRYPNGQETITGYRYEPWHIRYVGKEAAKEIYSRGITLEEYLTRE